MSHHKWTKMIPLVWREGRWAVRSMLWINKDVEAEQVAMQSPGRDSSNHSTPRTIAPGCLILCTRMRPPSLQSIFDSLQRTTLEMRRKTTTVSAPKACWRRRRRHGYGGAWRESGALSLDISLGRLIQCTRANLKNVLCVRRFVIIFATDISLASSMSSDHATDLVRQGSWLASCSWLE